MNITKLFLAAASIVCSLNAHAVLIEYAGFTHNTTTKITTGQGLEWRFAKAYDYGRGINQQTGRGEVDGWRTATTAEMATNLNAFNPIHSNNYFTNFEANENITQGFHDGWSHFNFNSIAKFASIFGGLAKPINIGNSIHTTWFMPKIRFGEDLDSDGKLNVLHGFVEWTNYYNIPAQFREPINYAFLNPLTGQLAIADSIQFQIDKDSEDRGQGNLLLVRDLGYVATVPEPTPLVLLLIGIVGLLAKRHFNTRNS